jgi:GNAT superfamily N-acetyltransferase
MTAHSFQENGTGALQKKGTVVRVAQEADAEGVCEVLKRSVREVCVQDHRFDQALLESWCGNKTPDKVRSWIRDSENFFLVLEGGLGQLLGAAVYNRANRVIDLCYLVPEAIGQGNGLRLLSSLEAEAKRLGHERISLFSTRTARMFYTRGGYVPNGEPKPVAGAVVGFPMIKTLCDLSQAS